MEKQLEPKYAELREDVWPGLEIMIRRSCEVRPTIHHLFFAFLQLGFPQRVSNGFVPFGNENHWIRSGVYANC